MITYLFALRTRRKDRDNKLKQYASMLYYDLESIYNYLTEERNLVNLRYSDTWQHILSECTFLESHDIKNIYKIYDKIYNYNYIFNHYIRAHITFDKDDIQEYKDLKEMFYPGNKNVYKSLEKKLGNHKL